MISPYERSVSSVAEYLTRHRNIPPERKGWFSSYEVQKGIKEEFGVSMRLRPILGALDFLLQVEPPAVEDSWMMRGEDKLPILAEQYEHPNQPNRACRFYRALGNATDYVTTTIPVTGLNLTTS